MYPYIHIILSSYVVMALVGGFIAIIVVFLRLNRFNIKFASFLFLIISCLIGGLIGSKLLFALTQIPWLLENFSIDNLLLLIPESGFVFYGGLFGVIITLCFVTRKDKEYKKNVFRLIVPVMPLFHAFGRIGCFLAGCCYGKKISKSIVIGPMVLSRIPVQLVEAIAEFVIFFVILFIDKKKEDVDLLRIYLISYAFVRFVDEFLRGDEIRGIYFGLSTSQWISILVLVCYLVSFLIKKIR